MYRIVIIFILILLCSVLMFSGCSLAIKNEKVSNIFCKFQNKKHSIYHDFCDVLIPSQLKVDRKKTCIFRTSRFSVGVLSLKGKIDSSELINFFYKNMADDNWYIVNSFKSKRSVLLFKKNNRWCVICVSEKGSISFVEIWVLPDENILLPEVIN